VKKTSNRHLSNSLKDTLDKAKHASLKVDHHGIQPETMASLIATGRITRERACDGKKRYRTYDHAENEVRPFLEERYGKKYGTYACPYCNGFHLHTEGDLAA
jgi:hypothetical protein